MIFVFCFYHLFCFTMIRTFYCFHDELYTNDAKTKVYGNDLSRRRLAYEPKRGEGRPTHP